MLTTLSLSRAALTRPTRSRASHAWQERKDRLSRQMESAAAVNGMSKEEAWRIGIEAGEGMAQLLFDQEEELTAAGVSYSGICGHLRLGGHLSADYEQVEYGEDVAYGGADSFEESPREHAYEEFSHFSERTSTVWTEGANGISLAWLRKNARVFACERARHVSGIELQFERLRVAAWAYRVAAWAYRVAA